MAHPTADGRSLHRGLRPLALFALVFTVSASGPYGLEETVPTAGPGLAILVLVAMAFVWGAPYALIIAELVAAIPEQGGSYRWYRAFLGRFWAFQFACLDWLVWILDAALYPPLLAAYLLAFVAPESGRFTSWIVCLVMIWGCTWINLRGVSISGQVTTGLAALTLLPVAAMAVLGWSRITLSHLEPLVADGTSIHSALSYALIFSVWSYSGYGGLAYASEEIVDPERTYPRILAIVLPLSAVIYVVPLLISLDVTPDWANWGTGHFTQVSLVLGGTWLAALTALGAQCGNLAIFNGEVLITSRLPYALAKDGVLPPIFAQLHSRYGTPSRFLILQAIFFSVVTYFFDFLEILVVSTWIGLPSYLLTFMMPTILRIKRPDLKGPFRIPGGWPGLLLCAIPPFAISVYLLVMVSPREMLLGLPFFAVGPLLYVWARRNHRHEGDERG